MFEYIRNLISNKEILKEVINIIVAILTLGSVKLKKVTKKESDELEKEKINSYENQVIVLPDDKEGDSKTIIQHFEQIYKNLDLISANIDTLAKQIDINNRSLSVTVDNTHIMVQEVTLIRRNTNKFLSIERTMQLKIKIAMSSRLFSETTVPNIVLTIASKILGVLKDIFISPENFISFEISKLMIDNYLKTALFIYPHELFVIRDGVKVDVTDEIIELISESKTKLYGNMTFIESTNGLEKGMDPLIDALDGFFIDITSGLTKIYRKPIKK